MSERDAPKLDERQRELFYELLEEESATIKDLARGMGWLPETVRHVMEQLESLGLVECNFGETLAAAVYVVDEDAKRRHDLGMKFG